MGRNSSVGTRTASTGLSEGAFPAEITSIEAIERREAGGSGIVVGLRCRLDPDSGAPQVGDGISTLFEGDDSINGKVSYGAMEVEFTGVNTGAHEAKIRLRPSKGGVLANDVIISPDGYLGLGNQDPTSILHIFAPSTALASNQILVTNANAKVWTYQHGSPSNDDWSLGSTDAGTVLYIEQDTGQVGINRTDPGYTVDISTATNVGLNVDGAGQAAGQPTLIRLVDGDGASYTMGARTSYTTPTISLGGGAAILVDIAGNNSAPAATGTTPSGALRLKNSVGTHVLDMGVVNGSYAWMQSTQSDNLANTFNLLLNPNGGNVGIGESNPSTFPLHVKSANAGSGVAQLEITNASHYAGVTLKTPTTIWNIAHPGSSVSASNQLYFHDGSSYVMTIVSGGKVGIGTNAPTSPGGIDKFLHISSNTHAGLILEDTSHSPWTMWTQDGSLVWSYSSTEYARLQPGAGLRVDAPMGRVVLQAAPAPNGSVQVDLGASSLTGGLWLVKVGSNARLNGRSYWGLLLYLSYEGGSGGSVVNAIVEVTYAGDGQVWASRSGNVISAGAAPTSERPVLTVICERLF